MEDTEVDWNVNEEPEEVEENMLEESQEFDDMKEYEVSGVSPENTIDISDDPFPEFRAEARRVITIRKNKSIDTIRRKGEEASRIIMDDIQLSEQMMPEEEEKEKTKMGPEFAPFREQHEDFSR